MKCPFCKDQDTKVLESRDNDETFVTRRRRECLNCSRRYTTYERIESPLLYVIKKDGRKELFTRDKLLRGLQKAFEKRPQSQEEIASIADDIEQQLRLNAQTEISSKKIGDVVMRKIKAIDKVAYIRFASVYKEFRDLEEFEAELEKLH